jgi:peptide/nickel transport system permease protein
VAEYIVRQIGSSAISLVIVVLGIFLVLRLFGDPTPNLLPDGTPEQIAQLREELGLSAPILSQLGDFLGGVIAGDFGSSYYDNRPVLPTILDHFAVSIRLVIGGILFAIAFGIPLGVLSAIRHNSSLDRGITALTILGQSMPTFWTGIILIILFAVKLHVVPSSGIYSPAGWILPTVTIGVFSMARFTRITRVSLLEILKEDYLRTARSKGLAELVVIYKHAVRNAMIPVVTLMGFRFAELLTSSVVVEVVFSIPGLGSLLVYDGIYRRDFPIVQAGIIFTATLVIVINLIVDLTYGFLDPRIKY